MDTIASTVNLSKSPFDAQLTEAALRLSPFNARLIVRFTETAEKTSGGIHLPDRMRENFTEAIVVAAGPGRRIEGSVERFPCWPRVGDVVTFHRHDAIALNEREAAIDAEDVLAIVAGDAILPMGDWVLVRPDPGARETTGGVRLADKVQRWRLKGTILEYGPGRLIVKGTCALRRVSVHAILNLPEDLPLAGLTVWWQQDAEVVQLGREVVKAWLVRAGHLLAYEEERDAEDRDRDRSE